ncbi:MAG: multidrug effflux MFS transporter [Pseudomonadota bacterium]|nr:multidrug effflux MFS transporter [Pseudomonadota bacterium]
MSNEVSVRYFKRSTPPHISTLILLAGLSALCMNIFLPSLPGMTTYFETDYRIMQLSVGMYLGFSAVLQILIGPISDKFGRRPVILWGLALFVLASIGCVFSTSVEMFLTFRLGQAAVVTSMVLSRAVVRDMYDTAKAASMIGFVTMGMSIVPMVGPAIGGFLENYFNWHANFWLLAGLGILAFWITWNDLGETKTASGQTLIEQFKEYPHLLVSPRFWGYTLSMAFCSGTFFAYLGGAPFVGTEFYGMTPAQLGLFFGAPAVGYMLGNFLSGVLSQRVGLSPMIIVGCILSAAGPAVVLAAISAGSASPLIFFAPMTLTGLGNGLTIPNATSGALSVRPHLAGTAAGLSGAMMIGLGAALSAWAGTLLTADSGPNPLLWLMTLSALLGLLSIIAVVLRERRLQA